MLSITVLRNAPDEVIQRLKSRGIIDAESQVTHAIQTDNLRRQAIQLVEADQQLLNQLSKEIGAAMKSGDTHTAEKLKADTQAVKDRMKESESHLAGHEEKLRSLLLLLPNLPLEDVPVGSSETDNVVLFVRGERPTLPDNRLPHWELAAKLGLIDFELGVKVTGAGFPVYLGQGARLQRALIQFFLDRAVQAGYTEVQPPLLVNQDSGFGTGQLPDKDGQMYYVGQDELYLIPTAEVPITNLYRDTLVDEANLPIRMCGYTPCFRREAGSYGAHVRGLNRLHQFDKVEIVEICAPHQAAERLEAMLSHATSLLDALELHYRALLLCTGDLGFASAKTIDLEVWSPGQERWLEVSSVSRFETFQAERLKLRYRPTGEKKTQVANTLNGSALALPRIVAGLLENGQQADGSIRLPKALVPYMGAEYLGR